MARPRPAFTVLLCALSLSLLPAVGEAAPTPEEMAEAERQFDAGVAFWEDPDGAKYEEAYAAFKRAHELSGSLNALLNVAICAQHLELDGEAIELYETYLRQNAAKAEPDDATQAEADLARLKATVSWVTLSASKPGATIVDVRTPSQKPAVRHTYQAGPEPKVWGLHAGDHVFTASLEGHPDETWAVRLDPGSKHTHTFTFAATAPPPETEAERPVPVYVWVAGGATLAAAGAWGTFLGLSVSKKAEYDEAVGVTPIEDQQEKRDQLVLNNTLADVFLGVSIAGAATTAVLFFTRPTVGGSNDGDRAARAQIGLDWAIMPTADPRGGGGALLSGSF